jgi:hypothetical protein
MRKTPKLLGDNIPFVQAHHVGNRRQRPTAIVLRTSFTTGDKGAALGIANAWHNPYTKTDSCHYVVDEFQAVRCVPDKSTAMPIGTGIYKRAISINVCYDPPDAPMAAVVARTARLVARLCKLYKIKPRLLSLGGEEDWVLHKWRSRGGIILKTVGDFPTITFLDAVKAELEAF